MQNLKIHLDSQQEAFEVIIPKLHEKYPGWSEIGCLQKILNRIILPVKEMHYHWLGPWNLKIWTKILFVMDNEQVRGLVIDTLGNIGSNIANDRLRKFLATDNEERLILRSTSALFKLGVYDIYPELRKKHRSWVFYCPRRNHRVDCSKQDKFFKYVVSDLQNSELSARTHISLLRTVAKYPEFGPSIKLFHVVEKYLTSPDPVIRHQQCRRCSNWLTYKNEELAKIFKPRSVTDWRKWTRPKPIPMYYFSLMNELENKDVSRVAITLGQLWINECFNT